MLTFHKNMTPDHIYIKFYIALSHPIFISHFHSTISYQHISALEETGRQRLRIYYQLNLMYLYIYRLPDMFQAFFQVLRIPRGVRHGLCPLQ